jgi:thiol-disulfide isomerase/thioredoxin
MINKLIFSPLLMLMTIIANGQQKSFAIKGSIHDKTGGFIYISYPNENDEIKLDSSMIVNGKFSFKGKLSGPVEATVMVDRNEEFFDKYTQKYIAPGKMKLSLYYDNFAERAVLKGSSVQADADVLEKMKALAMAKLKPWEEASDKASDLYFEAKNAKKDSATLEKLKNEADKAYDAMDPYVEEIKEIENAFMNKYPASYVTASIMLDHISDMKIEEAEKRYNKFPDNIKASAPGKEIRKQVDNLRMGSPGATAFVFSSKELRGLPLSLGDYKGKYVLLDFWASWCVPCRKGNPHLLSLYSKYKDKGFEIIGISDNDTNPEAWQKAVEKDQIGVWKHILRGLKWTAGTTDHSSDISERYGVTVMPTKILIDPNGVIIGRYGDGEEEGKAMDIKLTELFGG